MKGYIYALISHEEIYIGSTTQSLNERFCKHKRDLDCILLQFEDCYIELIEEKEFKDKFEMLRLERDYIENNDCINKKSHIEEENYKEKNKEKYKKWESDQ